LGDWPLRLGSLRDVAEMLRAADQDGAALIRIATGWGVEAVVAAAVVDTHRLLGTAPTGELSSWAQRYVPNRREERRLALYAHADKTFAAQALATVPTLPRLRDKAAYVRALVLPDVRYTAGPARVGVGPVSLRHPGGKTRPERASVTSCVGGPEPGRGGAGRNGNRSVDRVSSSVTSEHSPAVPPPLRRPIGAVAVLAALMVAVLAALYSGDAAPGEVDQWLQSAVEDTLPPPGSGALLIDFVAEPLGAAVLVPLLVALCMVLGRRRLAALAVAGPGLAGVVSMAVKPVVGRTIHSGHLSYPSGHTAVATVLALVLALLLVSLLLAGKLAGVLLVLAAAGAAVRRWRGRRSPWVPTTRPTPSAASAAPWRSCRSRRGSSIRSPTGEPSPWSRAAPDLAPDRVRSAGRLGQTPRDGPERPRGPGAHRRDDPRDRVPRAPWSAG